MAGTVVAVFDSNRQAEEAAQALLDDGVPLADVTLVFRGAGGEAGAPQVEGDAPEQKDAEYLTSAVREVEEHDVERPINTADEALPRAAVGLVIGATVFSLLASLLVFQDSLRALISQGHNALILQLGAGLIGGVIGAAFGALTSGGIPPEAAQAYHVQVQRGKTLVTVLSSSGNAPHYQEILRQHGGRRLGFFTRFLDTVQSVES
ncbi:MAG: hypothetical protein JO250_17940 [Armatimonadetes bacterium]|nr:hypothetical protein [Armatimonadota bacterium]